MLCKPNASCAGFNLRLPARRRLLLPGSRMLTRRASAAFVFLNILQRSATSTDTSSHYFANLADKTGKGCGGFDCAQRTLSASDRAMLNHCEQRVSNRDWRIAAFVRRLVDAGIYGHPPKADHEFCYTGSPGGNASRIHASCQDRTLNGSAGSNLNSCSTTRRASSRLPNSCKHQASPLAASRNAWFATR
jgi:hypothetical protein